MIVGFNISSVGAFKKKLVSNFDFHSCASSEKFVLTPYDMT